MHKLFSDEQGHSVTGSAFSQARYKIKHELFKELNDELLPFYYPSDRRLWKGHCLIAGDGSTLNLPSSKATKDAFGVHSTTAAGTNTYLARVVFLYDVLGNYVLNGQIAAADQGELTLLKKALQTQLPADPVIILDRGLGYMSTVSYLADQGLDFAVRISTTSSFAQQMLANDCEDQLVIWQPTKKEEEKAKKRGQPLKPLTVRVTRILLSSGEEELIVSSLTARDNYRYEDINELYHYRWPFEEGFKNLKPKMKIEQFAARKPEGILQEFYAHLFLMNLIALFAQPADRAIKHKTANRKHEYKYNWQNAFRTIRDKLGDLLKAVDITSTINWVINTIGKFSVAIKPGRLFIREPRSLKKSRKVNAYYK